MKTWLSKSHFLLSICVLRPWQYHWWVWDMTMRVFVCWQQPTTSVKRQQHNSAKSFVAPGCGPMLASTCGNKLEYPLSSCAVTVFTEGHSTDKLQLFPGSLYLALIKRTWSSFFYLWLWNKYPLVWQAVYIKVTTTPSNSHYTPAHELLPAWKCTWTTACMETP